MCACRYAAYCASSDFIREHIFPGGHLPSMEVISSYAATHNLSITSAVDIGLDYAVTLRQWRRNWTTNKQQLLSEGCSPVLHRKFEIYFAYCEAGFDTGYIQNYQITLQKTTHAAPVAAIEQTQTADHFTQVQVPSTLCSFSWRC